MIPDLRRRDAHEEVDPHDQEQREVADARAVENHRQDSQEHQPARREEGERDVGDRRDHEEDVEKRETRPVEHREEDRHERDRGAQVGLLQHEKERDHGGEHRPEEIPDLGPVLLPVRELGGEKDHRRHLGQLRRLDLDRAPPQPPLRAQPHVPDEEREHEERKAALRERPRERLVQQTQTCHGQEGSAAHTACLMEAASARGSAREERTTRVDQRLNASVSCSNGT